MINEKKEMAEDVSDILHKLHGEIDDLKAAFQELGAFPPVQLKCAAWLQKIETACNYLKRPIY